MYYYLGGFQGSIIVYFLLEGEEERKREVFLEWW